MPKTSYLKLVFALLFSFQSCSSNKYLSHPATPDFRIDGQRSEWAGRFEIPKKENFAIGVSNDKNYLYFAISSLDQGFERFLAVRGLTLWLDIKGGKRQQLGIRFKGRVPMNRHSRDRMDQLQMMQNSPGVRGDLDLIVIDDGKERMGPADLMATAGTTNGGLFIEYQVPLVLLGDDFDIEKTLGVGIHSTFERSKLRPQGQGGAIQGGGMGGQRGGGQGRGGGRPGMQGQRPDQTDLEVWIKVQLAVSQSGD